MKRRRKPELTWAGKGERPRVEPRALSEDAALSYRAPRRAAEDDAFDNRVICGDNLPALKALGREFAGEVKCVYIDPPYNTGNAFEHYDDSVEHSLWLSAMRDRLVCLRKLLRPDGFLCCHIDDSEGPYLKVLLDEVFGRGNYLTTFYVRVRYPTKTLKQDMAFHKEIEQVHIYRKESAARPNLNRRARSFDKFAFYVTEKGRGREVTLGNRRVEIFEARRYDIARGEGSESGLKEVWASGAILDGNSSGRFFRDYLAGRAAVDGLGVLYKVYGIGDDKFGYRYFTGPRRAGATKGRYYQGVPVSQLQSPEEARPAPVENFYDMAAQFGNCRSEGGVDFRGGKKPELLLKTILQHFSNPGDLVLDAFAGSGTTGAVAHKMGRRWIMVENGGHCRTHIVPRLRRVVDGADAGGVTAAVNWQGGGGFRYFDLAPPPEKDGRGRPAVNKEYNPAVPGEAL